MNNEISEEAKLAIANGRLVRARERLVKEGCQTDAAMRRRVLLLAAERNLPSAEYAKLMHKRIMMRSIHEFCEKHDVSMDWLMDGDLKGLQRMTREAKAPKPQPSNEDWKHLFETFGRLDSGARAALLSYFRTQIDI
jgi:hypothetical protein